MQSEGSVAELGVGELVEVFMGVCVLEFTEGETVDVCEAVCIDEFAVVLVFATVVETVWVEVELDWLLDGDVKVSIFYAVWVSGFCSTVWTITGTEGTFYVDEGT